jgi:crotonobetainyl-CoA:carnitine CoA-transferase CaiB-like acyl-CoA transferase
MDRPLRGLRVLDLSQGGAGEQAGGLLADYGADVILVEPPAGASLRHWSAAAASVFNRGKRSVVVDPSDAASKDRILALASSADVIITDGPVAGWEPEFSSLRTQNPALVCARLSGFGEGSARDLPAYEPLVHALLGTMATQAGHREGPIFQGVPFATTGAAQLAVFGILAALLRRLDDGYGRQVATSLWDGALAFHSMLWGESDASLSMPATTGRSMGGAARMRLITRSFLCQDGAYLGVHTGAVGAFGRLMEVLGLADRIPPTPNGIDMGVPLAPEQADLIEREIHGIFAAHPRDYWVRRLMEADVCAVEHQLPAQVFDSAQARHNGMVVALADPALGKVEQVAPGIRFDGAQPTLRGPAPSTGADAAEWLADDANRWSSPTLRADGPDRRPLLDGVKILDLGAFYAGPYSSRLMADLGADVIKLEPTAGDPLRGIERPFFSAQAGKRSLAVNLKDADLATAATALIKWADVVHHNMRPGAAERVGTLTRVQSS